MGGTPLELSVTRAVEQAYSRTVRLLFRPFRIELWLKLGFCAFLASLSEGGSGGCNHIAGALKGSSNPLPSFPAFPSPQQLSFSPSGDFGDVESRLTQPPNWPPPEWQQRISWFEQNFVFAVVLIVLGVLIAGLIGLLFFWLSCRGHFMLIDGVAKRRGAVSEPWREFRTHGNALMNFSIWLSVAALLFVLVVMIFGAIIAWNDIRTGQMGPGAATAIIVAIIVYVPVALAYFIVTLLLIDFIVPAQYLHGASIRDAWRLVHSEVIAGNTGKIVLYYVLKLLLGIGIGILAATLFCLTCCLGSIPYVGAVIMLPLIVFMRSYSLSFLAQLGPRWNVFDNPAWHDQYCGRCGYDLSYNTSGICPECGTPIARPIPPPRSA